MKSAEKAEISWKRWNQPKKLKWTIIAEIAETASWVEKAETAFKGCTFIWDFKVML